MSRSNTKNKKKKAKNAYKNSQEFQQKIQFNKEKKQLKNLGKMEKNVLIGVYDGFRKGGKFHQTLFTYSSDTIGTYTTEPDYSMYYLGPDDCGIIENGNTSIKMEVYSISETTMKKLMTSYGTTEELLEKDKLYLKKEIKSPFGDISVFIYNDSVDEKSIIMNGDWIEYIEKEKVLRNNKNSFSLEGQIMD